MGSRLAAKSLVRVPRSKSLTYPVRERESDDHLASLALTPTFDCSPNAKVETTVDPIIHIGNVT